MSLSLAQRQTVEQHQLYLKGNSLHKQPRPDLNATCHHRKSLSFWLQSRFNLSGEHSRKRLKIYLFRVLRHFQHCTGHIMTRSWKGRGNQYIQFVRVLYCKLTTNSKQLPAFPLEALPGIELQSEKREGECYHSATVAPEKT